MGDRLEVTPANVRAGAGKIDAENSAVTGLPVPQVAGAAADLPGFATAEALAGADDAVKTSLNIVGDRYVRMAELCRRAVKDFSLVDLLLPGQDDWLSERIGEQLHDMGDLNAATPGR